MARCFVLIGLLVADVQAFAPTPIQWGGVPGRIFFLAPNTPPNRALVLPSNMVILSRSGRTSPEEVPHFVPNLDNTIAWDNDFCLEAAGENSGDVIRINLCTGEASQLWDLVDWSHGRKKLLRLKGTSKCIDVKDQSGLDGAPVELQECDNNKLAESWTFEALLPAQGPAQHVTPSSWTRDAIFYAIPMFGLGVLSLVVWLRRGLQAAHVLPMRHSPCGCETFGTNHACRAGVSLCAPLANLPSDVPSVPAAWIQQNANRRERRKQGRHRANAESSHSAVMELDPIEDELPAAMALGPTPVQATKGETVLKVAREIDVEVAPMDLEAGNRRPNGMESGPSSQELLEENS